MNKINFISETDTKSIHEILNKKIKADLFLRKQPGVYFLIKGNEVVYVGQSEDVPVRI
jgi:excinuclease UvrABC nuclease subunit